MELQINDLVSSIKKDGIEAANKQAEEIINAAKEKANEIIENANKEAEKIKSKCESEIKVLNDSVVVSAEHAKRDAVISFQKEIKAQFERILNNDCKKTVDTNVLAMLIKAAISDENPENYVAEVAEVTDGLKGELASEIKNGLEIKPSSHIRVGFKLASKDGSGYFDCSDEEIATMLSPFFPELNI